MAVIRQQKKYRQALGKKNIATIKGILGAEAKVSTAKTNPLSSNKKIHVICVYTDDWKNRDDVMRVRDELRKLGIKQKILYKADIDTLKEKYAAKGDKKISKYFE